MSEAWERQEAGWWTHPRAGGVTNERGAWWLWRKGRDEQAPGEGPFKTMHEAMREADRFVLEDRP